MRSIDNIGMALSGKLNRPPKNRPIESVTLNMARTIRLYQVF